MITHYTGPKSANANPAWLREMIAMETEGERTPAQTDPPHEVVMDENTPALLRKQAA